VVQQQIARRLHEIHSLGAAIQNRASPSTAKLMCRVVKVVLSAILVCAVVCAIAVPSRAQQSPPDPDAKNHAQAFYSKLRSVGLNKSQVYKIREASLDRGKVHISLDDGTIAFTQAVDGHVTGAFYVGDGEVLLMPPNQMERASMSLFTGSAILEETFSNAYFRFNDDVYAELQPYLRTAEDPDAFVSEWDVITRNFAAQDALRLLFSFSESLPGTKTPIEVPKDHVLHAYLHGNKLGGFDVRYDSLLQEQVEAGQHKHVDGQDYYDVWTSFVVPASGSSNNSPGLSEGEEVSPTDLDVTSFKIQAHIRPVKELEAKATLSVVARQRSKRVLFFELSRLLVVSQVRADGQPVEFIHNQAIEGSHLSKEGNDVIAVILPSRLEKGQKLQLTFDYSGSVLSEAANGLLYVGEHGTWYPNRGFAAASFDLEFRYPLGWTLVATGHRSQTSNQSNAAAGEQTSKWVTDRPVPVAGFNLGKYSQTVSHAGKVAVVTYATVNVERGFPGTTDLADSALPPPPDPRTLTRREELRSFPTIPASQPPSPAVNAQAVGATSAKAIEFYERYFGPYPYGELSITQMPGAMSQGWPGLIFLSSYSFLTPEEKSKVQSDPVRRLLSDQVIAHETAHQWWGDLVNWSSYRDQWMMEALANYSALMLVESRDPGKFRRIMQTYRDDLMAKGPKGMPLMEAGPVTLGFRLSSSQFPGTYEPICYGRGTWLLHMLRTMMRDAQSRGSSSAISSRKIEDEPFLRALRKLRKDYEDKAVSTSELMRVFESELPPSLWYEGHKSLDWFYESWINGTAIPTFELKDLKFTDTDKGKGVTQVSGIIVQEQAPDTLVTAVPVYVSVGGKNIFLKRIFAEGQETQFHISAPAGVRKLVIDPEQTVLSRGK
jgi:Peptidase family M1 domain